MEYKTYSEWPTLKEFTKQSNNFIPFKITNINNNNQWKHLKPPDLLNLNDIIDISCIDNKNDEFNGDILHRDYIYMELSKYATGIELYSLKTNEICIVSSYLSLQDFLMY